MINTIQYYRFVTFMIIYYNYIAFDPVVCLVPGGTWRQMGTDINGEAPDDQSGYSVALSADGKTIAIGAIDNDGMGRSNSGHVRVFSFNTTIRNNWGQVGADINGAMVDDNSGWSVSMSADGTTVAVSAPYNDNPNGMDSGHVRVYSNNNTAKSWIQIGSDINGEAANDQSGHMVAMSDDGKTIAISAVNNDGNGNEAGHVRVYIANSPSTWTQLGLDINGENTGDYSGDSIAISADGRTVAIGAPLNDGNGGASGHARVFSYSSTQGTWNQLGTDIHGKAPGDAAGESIAMSSDGKTIILGAKFNDGNGNNAGHARVFTYNSTSADWTQVGNDIYGEVASDFFGFRVAMSADGTTVAVGSLYNDGNGTDAGHVRVYSIDPRLRNWTQVGMDLDGAAPMDYFGVSIDMSVDGTIIAIGASFNNGNGSDSGHVRVYQYVPPIRPPTKSPTRSPTKSPTKTPTRNPTKSPTMSPTRRPTKSPTSLPINASSRNPTRTPTKQPIISPPSSPSTAPDDNNDDTCGIFGLNFFCPLKCGFWKRLFNIGNC